MTTPQHPALQEQEKRDFVQRIADSVGFRHASRLREFLLFVTDRALSGRADEISEQHIGHAVFRRTPDYDTSNDNIVRVSARQLRVKLKEYAEHEGRDEPWSLEIPKGGYVPFFIRRESAATAAPSPPSGSESASAALRRWKIATAALAILALAALAAFWHGRSASAGRDTGRSPLTNLVLRAGQRTVVVLADSSMVLLHELTGHLPTPDDYATRQSPPPAKDPSLDPWTRSVASQQLTSVADVGFAVRLLRARPDAADRIDVIHARNLGPRNLKEGNAIVLGGPRSNPWAKLFEERLNYRFDFAGASSRIASARPRPGEAAFYETERRNNAVYRSYARIALVPNLDGSGRVLLLAGTTIEATEAATEFFLGRQSPDSLAQALGRDPGAGGGFEVLLETTAIGGTARSSRIVGARTLP